MKMKRKALLLTFCAVLLVAASVLGTMAYLTSQQTVTNTFTVGKVNIKLDEANVGTDGKEITTGTGIGRGDANDYKLIPGSTYDKDPMVTVLAGSEPAYVKMIVTITKADKFDVLFPPQSSGLPTIFEGYDATNWIFKTTAATTVTDPVTSVATTSRTYEFWYKEAVDASSADVELDALFDQIKVPGTVTGADLDTIKGMEIIVKAYAVQTSGFTDAADAWSKVSF